MPVQIIGRVLAESSAAQRFDHGVRETVGSVVVGSPAGLTGRALLAASRVTCRERRRVQSAADCVDCDRFVNYCPSVDRQHVVIRCLWGGSDPVHSLMRPRESILVVPRDSTLEETIHLARECGHRHVLVVDDELLVGMVDLEACETHKASVEVRHVMCRQLWVTFPDSTLADAQRIMLEHGVIVLPVVADTHLCGVLSLNDLVEVGLL